MTGRYGSSLEGPYSQYLTEYLTINKPQKLYLVPRCRSTDLNAQNKWKGRSGDEFPGSLVSWGGLAGQSVRSGTRKTDGEKDSKNGRIQERENEKEDGTKLLLY